MHEKRAPDGQVAEVAKHQHGAISIAQLHDAGLSDDAVLGRRHAGRLHRLHRGVYAVGHIAPSNERRWMAAVLAMGDGAVLSHRSAAALWALLPPAEGPVDISLPSRSGRRRRQGIRIHRPESLQPEETTWRSEIPVTSTARTLADLRSVLSEGALRQAIRQADFLGLPTGPDIEVDKTRSELERRFLWLCARHRLPKPAVNKRIGGLTVDFCWVEKKLIAETDGYRAHRGRTAFEGDRERDLRLRSLGFDVMHLSYDQVFRNPDEVIAVLKPMLGLESPLTMARRAR
jgi:very-short-patch-repair endonuclease